MDIAKILTVKFPEAIWTLTGSDYDGLEWVSETNKPTKKELEDLWEEVEAELIAQAQAKIDAKSSALSKLQALGLTVEEVQVAFGLNE